MTIIKDSPISNGSPPPRRERRSRDEILARIVRAASAEFSRHGFAGTTTASVARKADVTEAQLFRYFGSKANLFRETIFKPLDRHFLKFIKQNLIDLEKDASIKAVTHRYTAQLQRFIAKHSGALASMALAQTYDSSPAGNTSQIESLRTYFDHCVAITSARMPVNPKINLELLVRVSFVSVLGCVLFKDWVFPPDVGADEEITAAVSDFVLAGIAASRGPRQRSHPTAPPRRARAKV